QAALWLAPQDPRLHQNLALAYQWQGDLAKADPHWNRYVELADDRLPSPPGFPNYHQAVTFQALTRLATAYSEKGQGGPAGPPLRRARPPAAAQRRRRARAPLPALPAGQAPRRRPQGPGPPPRAAPRRPAVRAVRARPLRDQEPQRHRPHPDRHRPHPPAPP